MKEENEVDTINRDVKNSESWKTSSDKFRAKTISTKGVERQNPCITEKRKRHNCFFVNDCQKPNFRVTLYYSTNSDVRECTVFLYENNKEIIRPILNLLYPGSDILSIRKI